MFCSRGATWLVIKKGLPFVGFLAVLFGHKTFIVN